MSKSSIAAACAEDVALGHIFAYWGTYTYAEVVEALQAVGDDPFAFSHDEVVACLTYEDFSAGMLLNELESLYSSAKSAIVRALELEATNGKGN